MHSGHRPQRGLHACTHCLNGGLLELRHLAAELEHGLLLGGRIRRGGLALSPQLHAQLLRVRLRLDWHQGQRCQHCSQHSLPCRLLPPSCHCVILVGIRSLRLCMTGARHVLQQSAYWYMTAGSIGPPVWRQVR